MSQICVALVPRTHSGEESDFGPGLDERVCYNLDALNDEWMEIICFKPPELSAISGEMKNGGYFSSKLDCVISVFL
eukprot:maker-scaffold183_size276960-snap-gene-1.24 protein:Tk01760 transcript:maker-scaffold183_size276960-snap-gene-1.24-mRNA-1 annotation:"plastid-lipid-associated protein 8"